MGGRGEEGGECRRGAWQDSSPEFLCEPWGREQPTVLLDCVIPSQGLQNLWIGSLEESEDLGGMATKSVAGWNSSIRAGRR